MARIPFNSIHYQEPMYYRGIEEMLKSLFSDQLQISSFLLERLTPVTFDPDFPTLFPQYLETFSKVLKFLDNLGFIEHTGDWDPYLKITLRDGVIIETSSGYWDFKLRQENDMILLCVSDDPMIQEINIDLIQKVEVINQ